MTDLTTTLLAHPGPAVIEITANRDGAEASVLTQESRLVEVRLGIPGAPGPQGDPGPQGVQGPQGDPGAQGDGWQESFETVAQGLKSYPFTITRDGGGRIEAVIYDLGGGQSIAKTIGRDGSGAVVSIMLSGDLPGGIASTVKTILRGGAGEVAGVSYT